MCIYNTYIHTHQDFPPHEDEAKYHFVTCSTMKPTQWHYPGGGVNQVLCCTMFHTCVAACIAACVAAWCIV